MACEEPIVRPFVHHDDLRITERFLRHNPASFHVGLPHEQEDIHTIHSLGQLGNIRGVKRWLGQVRRRRFRFPLRHR